VKGKTMTIHPAPTDFNLAGLLERIENNQPVEKNELFDFIQEAMNKQGRNSSDGRQMRLHANWRGTKSPTGHVIPASMYHEGMEGRRIKYLAEAGLLPASLAPHWQLLDDLEILHDDASQRLILYFGSDVQAEFMRRFNRGLENMSIELFGRQKAPALAKGEGDE
jgi:hypothetical protein